jgi:hypothetical protein
MAYVPPHLRRKTVATILPGQAQAALYTTKDIQHYYWHKNIADGEEEGASPHGHFTLNESFECPSKLTHVILFHDANPRWADEKLIFAKSNLHLLPGYTQRQEDRKAVGVTSVKQGKRQIRLDSVKDDDLLVAKTDRTESKPHENNGKDEAIEKDGGCGEHSSFESNGETQGKLPFRRVLSSIAPVEIAPENTSPVAVFEQQRGVSHMANFVFGGWYEIERIAILAPFSTELNRMLEKKWEPKLGRGGRVFQKKRDVVDWKKSYSHEWAVIKLKKMDGEDTPAAPTIEPAPIPFPRAGHARKTVNKLLKEMRLGRTKSEEPELP